MRSIPHAILSNSRIFPPNASTSVTLGLPSVSVAVLSKSTEFISHSFCILSASLYSMPSDAPLPVAVIMATGVASPKAHGHETTSTFIAYVTQCSARKPPSIITHIRKVSTATSVTAGTKTPATLSANFCIGALLAPACLTIEIILERVVCSPTRSARNFMTPLLTSAADVTPSPSATSTGRLSPVTAHLSTKPLPCTITPSTGIYSP